MKGTSSTLTVMFEEPFWVGIYERESNGSYQVCKIVFGAEPSSAQVHQYLLYNWQRLRFSPVMSSTTASAAHLNPKRQQRAINKQLHDSGVGTKAQQALKLQQEQGKQARQTLYREQREADKQRRFTLKKQKRQQKHRGH